MKTVVGLFTALLVAAGLVAVTGSPASAACDSYSGCVDTTTRASAPKVVVKRKRATVCGTVTAVASNATPRGDLRITVTRNRGRYLFTKTIPYSGGKMCTLTKKVKKTGGYTVDVAFRPNGGSIFIPSCGSAGFDVVGR
jgi:hypothetical protein